MAFERTRQWGAVALAATLAACGGGGGGGTTSGGVTPPAATVTLSGVAATGAAFTGAVITVIDSRGQTVGTSQPVGDTGSYSITLSAGAVAPFVLLATRTDANGASQTLVSVVASTSTTTANITPITTLIASRLSPNGDPTQLDDALSAGTVAITPQAVADTVTEVQAILAPLLSATGTDAVNPLTGSFSTDGTGYDRLLDSLAITFIPASASSTNIEVSVKQASADGSQPTSVSFSSNTSAPPSLPTIDPATLPAPGLSVKVATFLQALTACYAVPFEQRVNGATSSVNAVTGGAADVIAPACRNVFSGNDPVNFLNNGGVVGRDASNNGAFSSLFRRAATGASFSQGAYEFTRADGSIVISYKSTAPDGSESYDTFVVTDDGDGVLRLIGNQYQYGGRVAAYHQRRNFITLNQGAYDYYSTGYSIDVPNEQVNGSPRFDRVLVTTPTGAVLTFKPSGNSSFLGLVKPDSSITGTSFVRLRSEYVDTSLSAPHPRDIDGTLFFVPTDRTEADLAAAKAGGTWKFDYFLAGNASATPDATQYYKNRARALTIGELRTQGLAPLSSALIAEIAAGANLANQPRPGQLAFDANEAALIGTGNGGPGWSVASGQLPPTSITLFGTQSGVRFTDSLTVSSTARSATVPCSRQSGSDTHCHDNGNGTFGPGFAAGATLNGLHLFARDPAGREYANFYAMYQLVLP